MTQALAETEHGFKWPSASGLGTEGVQDDENNPI